MRVRIRLALVLNAASLAAASTALLLAVGEPLLAARALGPGAFAALVAVHAVLLASLGAAILFRWVGRPVERVLEAAERLSSGAAGLPLLGVEGHGAGIARAAVTFERLAGALAEERARLAAKVSELEMANVALAETREHLLRSERLATMGRLAAGVAHEVGNPLGAIAGYADLARGRAASGRGAEAAEFLDRIVAETKRIDTIVRDLLDFARPTAPRLQPVDAGAVAEDAARLARMQPRLREVEVRVDRAGAPAVLADPGRLAQVFLNLLLNAGDAMGGRGEVTIAVLAAGADEVAIEVADDGPGIPEADLPRVFDPFFTTKAPGAGAGLGLAVCHGIIESFGGEITAANGPRRGAVFRLRLRAAPGGDT